MGTRMPLGELCWNEVTPLFILFTQGFKKEFQKEMVEEAWTERGLTGKRPRFMTPVSCLLGMGQTSLWLHISLLSCKNGVHTASPNCWKRYVSIMCSPYRMSMKKSNGKTWVAAAQWEHLTPKEYSLCRGQQTWKMTSPAQSPSSCCSTLHSMDYRTGTLPAPRMCEHTSTRTGIRK